MKNVLYLLTAAGLFACSPKLQSTDHSFATFPALPDTAFVVVLEEEDRFTGGQKTGIIQSTDDHIAAACAYDEIITRMKQAARQKGANIVKVTAHTNPDRSHRCEYVSAGLYRVDHPRTYERKFPWSADRPLTWADYKGNAASIRERHVGARTSCRFGIKIDTLTTPGQARVIVTNEFICYQSSAKNDQQKPAILAHEQLHFDLCEVYARSLRKTLSTTPLTPGNVTRISKDAFLETYRLYREQQALYDAETEHGLQTAAQEQWTRKVKDALASMEAYAR
ncbi:DUF922 domain-containing protein [Chitinophaga rhizophila]|uniref:Uncharacterized protein n=1 Tax=Chitinophaga rhizophila TaxID=2866212 RepID=A0ABS7G5R8_9BACT|nr:hypothetical protein [Chitinophaga rhizophila]MBW8682953.1 hypothetical protein [Chitinophaga rhizophila]